MAPLTLYRNDGSCSMIPHILLLHLQIPFTAVRMTMGATGYEGVEGTLPRAEFLKINPSGYVPTLVTADGNAITEMPALLTYIVSQVPGHQDLLGTSDLERARVVEFMAYISGTLHGCGYAAFWRPERFVEADASPKVVDAVKAGGHRRILHCYDWIERKIQGPLHAVGSSLTVVDIQLHTFYRWGNLIGIDMIQYAKLSAVAREVEKLEGVRTAMDVERQPLQFPPKGSS